MRSLALQQPTQGQVINRGSFAPPLASDPLPAAVAAYAAQSHGALITLDIVTLNGGDWQLYGGNVQAPDRSVFNVQSVDMDGCIRQLAGLGFQYAHLTLQCELGFELFQSRTPFNFASTPVPTGANGAAFSSPLHGDGNYGVRPGVADVNIVDKYVVACQKYGLVPGFYFNEIANFNVFNSRYDVNNNILVGTPRYAEWIAYQCRLLQEALIRWPMVRRLWMDKGSGSSPQMSQATFNAALSIDPNTVIIGNNSGETDFTDGRWPYHLGVSEGFAIPPYGNGTGYLTNIRYYKGVAYNTRNEIVISSYDSDGVYPQWFKFDDLGAVKWPVPPRPALGTVTPRSTFQAQVDVGKAAGCPVLIGVVIGRDGTMPASNFDILKQLNFGRNLQATITGDSITAGPVGGSGSDPAHAPIAFAIAKVKAPVAALTKFGNPGKYMRWFLDNQKAAFAAALVPQGRNIAAFAYGANDIPLRKRSDREADFTEAMNWTLSLPLVEGILLVPVMNRLDTDSGGYGYCLNDDGSHGDFNAERLHHNNTFLPSLLALSPKIKIAPIDTSAMFADNAPLNTALFTADKVHPTVAGSQDLGEQVLARGFALFGSITLHAANS